MAGARSICAQMSGQAEATLTTGHLPGMGSIATQPAFPSVARRALMTAVNTISRDLGLRPGTLVVLDALLSCLPCRESNGSDSLITPATLLTVFASNETLCFRAKGITDRQLRRHLQTLEAMTLVRRRDSANGKRFPILRGGKPIGAFGIDLSPLLEKSARIIELAKRRRDEKEELRGLRARILHLLASVPDQRGNEPAETFLSSVRKVLRRVSLSLLEAVAILDQLTALLTSHAATASTSHHQATTLPCGPHDLTSSSSANCGPERDDDPANRAKPAPPPISTATGGRLVRHKEPENPDRKKSVRTSPASTWTDLTEVSALYPREPASEDELRTIALSFGSFLNLKSATITTALTTIGSRDVLALQNRMALALEHIREPDAYFRRMSLDSARRSHAVP